MSETSKPFTKAEMDDMRQATHEATHEATRDAKRDQARLRQDFWGKLTRIGRQLPFAEDLLAAYYCAVDQATPKRVKLILVGALTYFVLPTDAIPDILPLFGFADDAAMLAAAISQVAGAINDTHRDRARETLRDKLN